MRRTSRERRISTHYLCFLSTCSIIQTIIHVANYTLRYLQQMHSVNKNQHAIESDFFRRKCDDPLDSKRQFCLKAQPTFACTLS